MILIFFKVGFRPYFLCCSLFTLTLPPPPPPPAKGQEKCTMVFWVSVICHQKVKMKPVCMVSTKPMFTTDTLFWSRSDLYGFL